MSYWSEGKRWINSPGFVDGTANFGRPVSPGCLECHVSFVEARSANWAGNRYVRETMEPGIRCETCHGPGAKHVALYSQTPPQSASPHDSQILNPAKFSRDRQVDACALCHNGIAREALRPAFTYQPGKPLSEFYKPLPTSGGSGEDRPDVHGNQVGLLERSRCYTASNALTCTTCHEVHAPEKAAASYSAHCLTCHQWQSCGASRTLGAKIQRNCIDCHMPVQPTSAIVSETAGVETRAAMRTHWIKVYPEQRLP